jgi:hypothetical protein
MSKNGFPFISNNKESTAQESFSYDMIKKTEKCYKSLEGILQKLSSEAHNTNFPGHYLLDYLRREENTSSICINVGETAEFAVVLRPVARIDRDEYVESVLERQLSVRLLSVNSIDVQRHVSDIATSSSAISNTFKAHLVEASVTANDMNTAHPEPLKTRIIPIQAKICRSEMVVQQKNINFGRVNVGESTKKTLSIVNRSSVPLFYSISKSGSISSAFLQISGDRKGKVDPFGTGYVELVFKPTLKGSFEESIVIENILAFENKQTVVIKAKITKPDTFLLLDAPSQLKQSSSSSSSVSGSYTASMTSSPSMLALSSLQLPLSPTTEPDIKTKTSDELISVDVSSQFDIVQNSFKESPKRLSTLSNYFSPDKPLIVNDPKLELVEELLASYLDTIPVVDGVSIRPTYLG